MRLLQVGVPFIIVGRSRKSWIRWNRNSFPGCDATLHAHSGIGQPTAPRETVRMSPQTYNGRVNLHGEQRRPQQFLLPDGSETFSLKGENHHRSFSGR
jgi:hypothetical protein